MTETMIQRRAMVDSQLKPQGVSDPAVLAAFATVPREQFVPERARAFAYFDRSIGLRDGRWMMSPAALGLLIEALVVKAGETALVVGSTGYAAAILADLGAVVSEVGLDFVDAPRGPFDMILVEGAVEHVPEALDKRLAPGGRLPRPWPTGASPGSRSEPVRACAPLPTPTYRCSPVFSHPQAFTF